MSPSENDTALKSTIQLPWDSESDPASPSESQNPIEIKVTLENTTAGTRIAETQQVQVMQMADNGVTLQIPERSCAVGHKLLVNILGVDQHKKEFKIDATGQVVAKQNLPSGFDEITVKFLQFDEGKWKELLESVNSRQKEIIQFFEASKG